jgi:hypothetical protein
MHKQDCMNVLIMHIAEQETSLKDTWCLEGTVSLFTNQITPKNQKSCLFLLLLLLFCTILQEFDAEEEGMSDNNSNNNNNNSNSER